jgi:ribonuclease BN (tRNA processing enzyme)
MKVELVPTMVSGSPHQRGQFLTSYIIDGTVAIDAGGLGLLGELDRQAAIRHLFITHPHSDHIASLPLFLENTFQVADEPVTLHASRTTIDTLARHVFNNEVWPDFFDLSQRGPAFVRLHELHPGTPVEVEGLTLTPIPVDHVIPTLGFLVESPGTAIAIPSDTGPTLAFWEAANALPEVAAVFLESSFPDSMIGLARVSKHLTPRLFAAEAAKLRHPADFLAVHLKPRTFAATADEILRLSLPGKSIRLGEPGFTYQF